VCVGACEKPDGADQARRGSQAKEEAWNHHPSVGIGARWVGQRRGSPNQGRSAVDEVAVWLHTSERDGGEEPTQEEGSNRKAGQNGRSDHWVLLDERWALRRGSRRPCLYRARHGEDGTASRRRKSLAPTYVEIDSVAGDGQTSTGIAGYRLRCWVTSARPPFGTIADRGRRGRIVGFPSVAPVRQVRAVQPRVDPCPVGLGRQVRGVP
jgi:hypothetical protein